MPFRSALASLFAVAFASAAEPRLAFRERGDVVDLVAGEAVLASYHTRDARIRRPFFANLRTTAGVQVTRTFPLVDADKDGADHPDMHPGVWLAFGDINGVDFWRNKGALLHERFVEPPSSAKFAAMNRFVAPDGKEICRQLVRAEAKPHAAGWTLALDSELWSDAPALTLGQQEEMGLGIRVATPLREKSGGLVTSSLSDRGAKTAWGKIAAWWDYSGTIGGQPLGVLAVPGQSCWGHTRDYGVMVLNPVPRKPAPPLVIQRGEKLRLRFTVLIHSGPIADLPTVAATLTP